MKIWLRRKRRLSALSDTVLEQWIRLVQVSLSNWGWNIPNCLYAVDSNLYHVNTGLRVLF